MIISNVFRCKQLEWMQTNGWAMSQKLSVNGFEWVKRLSKFDERLIKIMKKISDKGYFLEVDIQYPNDVFSLHSDLLFLPERNKIVVVHRRL